MPNRQERKTRTKAHVEVQKQEDIINDVLLEQSKLSKLERAEHALQGIKERNFKMFFFVPETGGHASGAIIEIYTQVSILRKAGLNAIILAERKDYVAPTYLDQDLQALPHLSAESTKFVVAPEDWLIIPEYLTPLMEQTKKMSCTRVVLAQNYDHIITSNLGGMTWKDLGMEYVVATSERMKEFIEEYHGAKKYDIQTYTLGVPDYFANKTVKKPVISFFSRNADDIKRISKLFYYKYPELQWVVFEDLRGTNRQDFAKKLASSEVLLFLDRIASFGQPVIEAMKTNTIVVALAPDIIPEYMESNSGIWCADYYKIPELLGKVFKMIISDEFPEEIRANMKDIAALYSPANSEASVLKAYSHFISKREEILQEAVEIETKMAEQLAAEQAKITETTTEV